ncbi:MAG: hypothetical protein H6700_10595, partial [Myxococcales bacterium]|nr:hypothetical protein [Myxococcales bacterium]
MLEDWLIVAISVVPLVVAPYVFAASQRSPAAREALDGFVLASIGLLVFVHLVPHAIDAAGGVALIVALAG